MQPCVSAVTIAERHPDLYEAVGAIAGCYTARDDLGFILAKIVAETRGGNIANMWGPRTDPDYLANDGLLNAARKLLQVGVKALDLLS